MTRINLISPQELSDQHLLAEMRELPRIFTHVEKYGVAKDIHEKFCLGTGHVKFFTNKLNYLAIRYNELVNEWENRGFNWSYNTNYFIEANRYLMDINQIPWRPSSEEIVLSRSRIQEKLKMKPNFYTWRGQRK